jgi:hypothetical protein
MSWLSLVYKFSQGYDAKVASGKGAEELVAICGLPR